MIRNLLVGWVVLAVAIGLVAGLLPGLHINGGALTLLWVAALYALVNVTLGTIITLLTAPIVLLTLGLFTIVINAAMFSLIDYFSDSLDIDGFGWALLAAVCVSVCTLLLAFFLRTLRSRVEKRRAREPRAA
ncbi:MAG TPA: phage holin family protein [Actinophytocola sp.]|jgi:putative membrane protein|nr:phage holin family protein [Actinophytocola sp.]